MTDMQDRLEIEEEQEINLLELLQVLVKRKMFIVKVCILTIAASVIYCLYLPNIYTATAKVLPPQKEGGGGGLASLLSQAGGLAGLAAGGLGGGGDLYLGILKSRSVEDAVIQRLDLVKVYKQKNVETTRRVLEGAVKIQAGKDGIISIVADDKDPKRSALLANTFVEELGKTSIRLNLSKAGSERVFLERRLSLVKNDLKAAEDDLKSFAQRNKVIQVESQAKASIEGVARLKAELASREVQLAVLSSNRTDKSPEVEAIQTGIKRLRGEIASLSGSGGGGDGIPSIGNVPGVGLEYARKMREFKTQEAIFEQLEKQYELAKFNEAKDSSSLQVLDEAVVPLDKSKPAKSIIVIVSALCAFLVSVVIILAQDYLAKMSDEDRKLIDSIKKYAVSLK